MFVLHLKHRLAPPGVQSITRQNSSRKFISTSLIILLNLSFFSVRHLGCGEDDETAATGHGADGGTDYTLFTNINIYYNNNNDDDYFFLKSL